MAERYQLEGARPEEPSEETPPPNRRLDEEEEEPSVDPGEAIARALIHDSENSDVLGKILRYETSLTNTLARALSMLMTLQSARAARE